MEFLCIADEDTVLGFKLAGIAGQAVASAADAAKAVVAAVAQPDIGVLILTSSVAVSIRGQVEEIRLERERPLIVEIPDAGAAAGGGLDLNSLVQEAIGMSLDGGEGA